MFTQKLRLPYTESPAGTSSAFFRPEYSQYNPQWETTNSSVYENQAPFDHENDSALSRIYTLAEDKPMLLSPLVSEQLNRADIFTPEMKLQTKFDDLELQVLSSAPSELSSWSESEERPSLVKYDSESSLEHYHSVHFNPHQFSNCGTKLNFSHVDTGYGFNNDVMYALGNRNNDAYQQGWRYFGHDMDNANHVDLSEMVEGVFPGNSPQSAKTQPDGKSELTYGGNDSPSQNMPVGLRNALSASHRAFHLSFDVTGTTNAASRLTSTFKQKPSLKTDTPPAENFMLRPWPVNDNVQSGVNPKGQDPHNSLRVPLPCLSAAERWKKHNERYTLDPKLSGDMICTHCDQTFDDVQKYITHLDEEKIVHDNFCPDMSCAFAALGYRYRWLLRRHICNHHLKDYNNKKLRKSSTSSGSKNALTESFLSHVYVCKKKNCSRAFYRLDSLLRHEKLIHSVGGKQKRKERLKLGKCDPKIFE